MSKRPGFVPLTRARSRAMGAIRSHDLSYNGATLPGNTNPYSGSVPNVAISGTTKVTNDFVTKGYSGLIARGVRLNNPYSSVSVVSRPFLLVSSRRTNYAGTSFQTASGAAVSWIMGALDKNLPANPLPQVSLSKSVTIKAWAGVEPAKSQSLVTVLEAHKSWDTLWKRAQQLARVVDAVRRKDVKQLQRMFPGARTNKASSMVLWDDDGRPLLTKRGTPRRYTKAFSRTNDRKYFDEASQLWLEYRYGWSPIVYDMIDTLKAVYEADLRNELLPKTILKSSARVEERSQIVNTSNYLTGGLLYTGNRTTEFDLRISAYIHYRHTAPDGMMRKLNDFGLFDVPRAIWEVVPFSFIADWFIPIGDWLGALTPKIGVEIIDVGHVVRNKIHATQTISGYPPASANYENGNWPPICAVGSSDLYDTDSVERLTFLGIPTFPPIDVKIGIKRMVDVAALFRGIR